MNFDPDLPFDLPPIGGYELKFDEALHEQRLAAHVALAELRMLGKLLPRIEVMTELLLLEEAEGSCRIENILTTQDSLYEARAGLRSSELPKAEQEVLGYVEALQWASKQRSSNTGISIEMISEVQRKVVLDPLKHGFRTGPVRIVTAGANRQVLYTAPEADRVKPLLQELINYLNKPFSTGIDPLVRLALAHYQFESIHPFPDGNGRTGRVLNALVLEQTGVASGVVPYLSRWFQLERGRYYAGLQAPRTGAGFEPWVNYVLEGITVTTRHGIERIEQLRQSMNRCALELREALGSRNREGLVETLFRFPYVRIEQVASELKINRDTASAILKTVTDAGILIRVPRGTSVLFLNRFMLSEPTLTRAKEQAERSDRRPSGMSL